MRPPAGEEGTRGGRWIWHILGLLALAGWLAGVRVADHALVDPDEPRSAIVARLMVERGDWLVPHLPVAFQHDYPQDPVEGDLFAYWDKPPLFFWLAALAMRVLGPTALAVRLPSAAGHVATVLLVYACGRFLWDRRAGLAAGIVAAATPLLMVMAHVARMETLLTALMTAMLLAVLRLLHDRPGSWRWVAVLYVSAGLAVLTKGPAAVVLPAAAVGVTFLLRGRWGDLRRLRPLAGLGIVLLISAPWFIYMHVRYPAGGEGGGLGFSRVFFVSQHLLRATTDDSGHYGHLPGYLLGILLLGFLPWTILLPGACLRLCREGWRERRQRPAVVLLLAWAAVVVAAFSLSTTQLPHYVMPAAPALAILVGAYLADRTAPGQRDRLFGVGLWVMVVSGAVTIVGLVASLKVMGLWHSRYLAVIALMVGILAAGVVSLRRGRRQVCMGLMVAWLVVAATFAFSADPFDIYGSLSTHRAASILTKHLGPGDRVMAYPRPSYSLVWFLWPREVPFPTAPGGPPLTPSLDVLVDELNQPRRTFVVLFKHAALDRLRQEVRWPITVLVEKRRHTVIVTEPPGAEVPHES